MEDTDDTELPGYTDSDPEQPEDNIDENVESYNDSVSYFIYNENENDQWIRSTITLEQSEDEDGYEKLESKQWKRQQEDG